MLHRFLLILTFQGFYFTIFSIRAQEVINGKVISLHPSVGEVITVDEKNKFGLFSEYPDSTFQSAMLIANADKSYSFLIKPKLKFGKSFYRNTDEAEIKKMHFKIEHLKSETFKNIGTKIYEDEYDFKQNPKTKTQDKYTINGTNKSNYNFNQNNESHTLFYPTLGYNTYINNYKKVYFLFQDSINNRFLFDSIPFKGPNNNFRIGINIQHQFNNNLLFDLGTSASLPVLKNRIQLIHNTIGIGYCFNLNEYISLKPLLLLETNKHYYSFNNFKDSISLIVYGKDIGKDVKIKYAQVNRGLTAKLSTAFHIPDENIELCFDYGYSFPLHTREYIEFKPQVEYSSSNNIWVDAVINSILFAYQYSAKKRTSIDDYMTHNGNILNKKIITPENFYFEVKCGFKF